METDALIEIGKALYRIRFNQLITTGVLLIPLLQISWYLRDIAKILRNTTHGEG